MSAMLQMEKVTDSHVRVPVMMKNGEQKHVDVSLDTYNAAGQLGMSLSQYLDVSNPDADTNFGTVFEQCLQAAGMVVFSDQGTGLQSSSLQNLLKTGAHPQLSAITRTDGQAVNTVAGRLFVTETILQAVNANLTENNDDFFNGIESAVALTENYPTDSAVQPLIDTTAPESSRSGVVAQLAEPPIMVSITASQRRLAIPTRAIGLEVSDQALSSTSLDLVNLTLAAQSRGERIYNYETWLKAMIDGDTDASETALDSITAQSLDAGVTVAGTISHKAWIKFLRSNYRIRNIDMIFADLDAAFAIDSRSGRPTAITSTTQLNTAGQESIMNLLVKDPRVLILDSSVIGANTIVGIDTRYAIRRARNLSASYSAVEQYVIRRATQLRIDYAEMMSKLFTEAWQKMTLTVSG